MMGRLLRNLSRTVAIPSNRIFSFIVIFSIAYDTLHDVFVLCMLSFPWYIIRTFNFCSLLGFLGCSGQCDTIEGYDVMKSANIICNRMFSYLKYLK